MAINPPSDVVLGVALAADPQKYQVAAERLRRLSSAVAARQAEAPAFDVPSLESQAADATRNGGAQAAAPIIPASPRALPAMSGDAASFKGAPGGNGKDMGAAFQQLEAFVMQTFVQSMLPKNATSVFGKGTAGDVWKSMMAEKLGAELARSGQVGIAKRLAGAQAAILAQRGPALANGLDSAMKAAGLDAPGRPPAALAGVLPYLQAKPAAAAGAAVPETSVVNPIDPLKRS